MLNRYMQRHNSLRNELLSTSSDSSFAGLRHNVLQLSRELTVLARTSIIKTHHASCSSPFEQEFVRPVHSSSTAQLQSLYASKRAHYAKVHFHNVTLKRFELKCLQQRNTRISNSGKQLGIWMFKKWKQLCYIKRRLRALMDHRDLHCLQQKYASWKMFYHHHQQHRRYMYSIVKTRHVHKRQHQISRVCLSIWYSYTARIRTFRIQLKAIALRVHKIHRYVREWRVIAARTIQMKRLIRKALASTRDRLFLSWKQWTRTHIAMRRQFCKRWDKRKEAAAFRQWKIEM